MDWNTILQAVTSGGILVLIGVVLRLSVELGGFREWRKHVDARLQDGKDQMRRHSEKIDVLEDLMPNKPKPRPRSQDNIKRLK